MSRTFSPFLKLLNTRKASIATTLLLTLGIFISLWSIFDMKNAFAAYPIGDEYVLYDFEEASGDASNAGSGAPSFDGTFGGDAARSTSVFKSGSSAATFDTNGDYVNTQFGSGRNVGTNPLTITLWARKDSGTPCSGGDRHLLGVSATPAASRMYVRCISSGGLGMRVAGNTQVTTPTFTTDTWHHVALVMTGSQARLYVDGTLQATSTYSAYSLPGPVYIGNVWENSSTPANQGWGGQVDDVAIYQRALSDSEVLDSYSAFATLGSVTNLTAIPYSNKVALSWTAPVVASGTPAITDYAIEYKTVSAPTYSIYSDGVSSATTSTVTGLTTGVGYNFRVVPINSNGYGASSTAAVATTSIQVSLIDPTPDSETVNSSDVTIYSSSTNLYAVHFDTQVLTNPGALLVASSSTSYRNNVNFDLTKLTRLITNKDLTASEDNYSGVAYVSTTNTIFIVRNSRDEIKEYSIDGTLLRTITCSSCGDIEGITLISSVSNGSGGYNHTFMISTEDYTANARIFRVIIPSSGSATVDATTYWQTGITHGSNLGLEGIAYNASTSKYYVNTEKTNIKLYEVTLGSAPSATSNEICTNLNWASLATDVSDLAYHDDILYALSHESQKLIPINIASTTNCIAGSPLSLSFVTQAEGVSWSPMGDKLFVVGESDFLTVYQGSEIAQTITGLANGNYQVRTVMTDSYGNTDVSDVRTFTVSYDASAPVVSDFTTEISTSSATLGWSTDEQATSTIYYGLTSSYGNSSTGVGSQLFSFTLSDLNPSTVYHYQIVVSDEAGNYSTSTDATFTTTALPTVTVENENRTGIISGVYTPWLAPAFILQNRNQNSPSPNTALNNTTAPTIPGSPSTSRFTIQMVTGVKHAEVQELQKFLNRLPGYLVAENGAGSPGKETNFYGSATRAAIQKLQLNYKIVNSAKDTGYGVVGPKTRALLNSLVK